MLRNLKRIQREPLPFLEHVWRVHGDVVQFPVPAPVYLVSQPALARDVLVEHHKVMGKKTLQYSTLSLVTGEGLLTADTQAWLPRRRMLQPAFHRDLLTLMNAHIERAVNRIDSRWQEACAQGNAIVDVDADMMELALDITGAALFGIDLADDAREITEATLDALHGVIARAQNPLPLPLRVPTPNNRAMVRAVKTLDRAIARIVDSRSHNLLPEDSPIRDMLDVLLDSSHDLTPEQIRDEIATFVVAGHETVASGLTWAWNLLAHSQEEQDKLSADASRGSCVFDEALRLYPPAWVITRRALADIELGEYRVPKGSMVIVSPWVVHRNPDAWPEPNAFKPDRFVDGAPQVGYLPFGAGPRLCIGRDLARMEGAAVLAQLAAKWRLEPIHSGEVAIEASVTLRPVGGLPLRISKR
jgi:cytochrome P450